MGTFGRENEEFPLWSRMTIFSRSQGDIPVYSEPGQAACPESTDRIMDDPGNRRQPLSQINDRAELFSSYSEIPLTASALLVK